MEEPFKLKWKKEFGGEGREEGVSASSMSVHTAYTGCLFGVIVPNAEEDDCLRPAVFPDSSVVQTTQEPQQPSRYECTHACTCIHTNTHRQPLHHLPLSKHTHICCIHHHHQHYYQKPRAQSLWDDLISNDIWKRPHRANKIKLRPCLFAALEICKVIKTGSLCRNRSLNWLVGLLPGNKTWLLFWCGFIRKKLKLYWSWWEIKLETCL